MTSKLVVNTIEADTGISSVSFASSISMDSTSKFHFSAAGVDIGADTNINRPAAGVLGFNISGVEKVRIDTNGHLNTSGIVTAANFKTGVTNLHSTGLTLTGGQLDVGSNIKVGTAGVITATSFVGSGANLTSLPSQLTLSNNADNRIITGGSGVNLNGESNVVVNGGRLGIGVASPDVELHVQGAGDGMARITSADGSSAFLDLGDVSDKDGGRIQYNTDSSLRFSTASSERLRIASNGDFGFNDTAPTANASGNDTVLSIKGKGSSYSGKIDFKDSSGNIDNHIASDNALFMFNCDPNTQNGNTSMQFSVHGAERFRFGRHGQIGVAGANYGTARETIVSGGASAAVSWSANPFVIDMAGLGDIDYGKMFVRYRETATISGNGLVYLGICKSTTNCPAGRAGTPIGFIPSTVYNGHFRVDKIGITPWPDGSGHRYEYYAIISDYASSGKLGVFYLTNTTS